MPLINCEVNSILTWSSTCVITNSTGAGRFAITDTKLFVPVVTVSTQDNTKLLQSSNINEVTRVSFKLFFFFYHKISQVQKCIFFYQYRLKVDLVL